MQACGVKNCVALAQTDGRYCRVHATRGPGFRVGDSGTPGQLDDCDDCEGTGICQTCDGDGDHACECGDEHDCHVCGGSGKCESCRGRGTSGDIGDREKAYLEWAWMVLEPRVVVELETW